MHGEVLALGAAAALRAAVLTRDTMLRREGDDAGQQLRERGVGPSNQHEGERELRATGGPDEVDAFWRDAIDQVD